MRYTRVETPIGTLTLLGGDAGLRKVLWDGEIPPDEAKARPDHVDCTHLVVHQTSFESDWHGPRFRSGRSQRRTPSWATQPTAHRRG